MPCCRTAFPQLRIPRSLRSVSCSTSHLFGLQISHLWWGKHKRTKQKKKQRDILQGLSSCLLLLNQAFLIFIHPLTLEAFRIQGHPRTLRWSPCRASAPRGIRQQRRDTVQIPRLERAGHHCWGQKGISHFLFCRLSSSTWS